MRSKGEQQPLWKTTTITTVELGKRDGPLKLNTSGPYYSCISSPAAALSTEALHVDGAEPMNLASQSGDAGGSQLLFANFNQDNT